MLGQFSEARSSLVLAIHIAAGAAIYLAVLGVLYARTLNRMRQSRVVKPAA